MNATEEIYGVFEDEEGETVYCPMEPKPTTAAAAGRDFDECVEASVAGRYSGNLDVVDRFAS